MTSKVITEISQTRSAPNLTTVAGGQAVEEGALTQSTAVVADVAQVVLGWDFVDTLVRVQIVGAVASWAPVAVGVLVALQVPAALAVEDLVAFGTLDASGALAETREGPFEEAYLTGTVLDRPKTFEGILERHLTENNHWLGAGMTVVSPAEQDSKFGRIVVRQSLA